MTDLTEQWYKGELSGGAYYVTYDKNDTPEVDIYRQIFSLHNKPIKNFTINQVTKILAPVPSYEELENMNKAVNECMAANIKLVEQNAKLKELLKECKMPLEVFADKKPACEWYPEDLLTRIDEVLK